MVNQGAGGSKRLSRRGQVNSRHLDKKASRGSVSVRHDRKSKRVKCSGDGLWGESCQGRRGRRRTSTCWERQASGCPQESPERTPPCQPLDFRFMTHRAVREHIRVISSQEAVTELTGSECKSFARNRSTWKPSAVWFSDKQIWKHQCVPDVTKKTFLYF